MKKIKIPYGSHFIDQQDIKNVSSALKSDLITQGPIIEKFEKKICKFLKVKYAVAVSSCTAGLHIALSSIINKKKNKDKVITSPISFVSTANTIGFNDLKPEFVDINKSSLNINYEDLKKKILKDKKIKAVIPVHLAGYPGDSKKIYELCKKNNIKVIEDAAHSFGSKYEDKNLVGCCKYSDLTVFSFHPVKTITTGEGGIVTTNSKKIFLKLKRLRSHGIEKKSRFWKNKKLGFTNNKPNLWYYEMQERGFNYRITDFQCALGLSQLKKIKPIINKRIKIAKLYDKEFSNCKNVFLPQYKKRELSSNHLYILNINFKKIKTQKNEFMLKLLKKNIITQVHYIPIFFQPFYKNSKLKLNKFTNSLNYYEQALSIPIYYNLSISKQKKIIKEIKKLLN